MPSQARQQQWQGVRERRRASPAVHTCQRGRHSSATPRGEAKPTRAEIDNVLESDCTVAAGCSGHALERDCQSRAICGDTESGSTPADASSAEPPARRTYHSLIWTKPSDPKQALSGSPAALTASDAASWVALPCSTSGDRVAGVAMARHGHLCPKDLPSP